MIRPFCLFTSMYVLNFFPVSLSTSFKFNKNIVPIGADGWMDGREELNVTFAQASALYTQEPTQQMRQNALLAQNKTFV